MSAQPLADGSARGDRREPAGPQVGAFFDLDGTLVDGFTATAHAGDRIRRRQARIGEVLGVIEASMRYRLGRMRFEHLVTRAPAICAANRWPNSTNSASDCSPNALPRASFPCMREIVRRTRSAATPSCSARRR